MKTLNLLFVLVFTCINYFHAYSTAQYGDKLIVESDTVWIYSNPLEQYFEKKSNREIGKVKMIGGCTALWRGYVATWKLENDSLFLVRIQTRYCGNNPIEIDISKEFHSKKVFASWANLTITQPKGELLQYVHMGYGSVFEEELYYIIENGKLKKKEKINNLIVDKYNMSPSERLIKDSIQGILLRAIDTNLRNKLSDDHYLHIIVSFGKNRKIKEIRLGVNDIELDDTEKEILLLVKESLKRFPRLMKVRHKFYSPPVIHLGFVGYCLKNPLDRDYGCDDE